MIVEKDEAEEMIIYYHEVARLLRLARQLAGRKCTAKQWKEFDVAIVASENNAANCQRTLDGLVFLAQEQKELAGATRG